MLDKDAFACYVVVRLMFATAMLRWVALLYSDFLLLHIVCYGFTRPLSVIGLPPCISVVLRGRIGFMLCLLFVYQCIIVNNSVVDALTQGISYRLVS
ncbi:unnamed protein product [Ilex paraguariensis]|uniref:Uncharacterized protein n=1 Tax=Ilex paraguariensis TaxID=185542 RepID=A0ABC8V293_9AQUA